MFNVLYDTRVTLEFILNKTSKQSFNTFYYIVLSKFDEILLNKDDFPCNFIL